MRREFPALAPHEELARTPWFVDVSIAKDALRAGLAEQAAGACSQSIPTVFGPNGQREMEC
jgi:hypothetical protein